VTAVDCTHIQKTSSKVVCQKADDNCFLGQERSVDGGIHATRDHNSIRNVYETLIFWLFTAVLELSSLYAAI
jgi:hypothetical protein